MKEALCLPRYALDQAGPISGFQAKPAPHRVLGDALRFGHAEFRDRSVVEDDPSFKQLIPYVVIRNERGEILTYTRSAKQGDERLRSKVSIGVGGHVERRDQTVYGCSTPDYLMATLLFAAKREVMEEVGYWPSASDIRPIGLVNDDSDAVGRVHLGVVCELTIPSSATLKECSEIESRFWSSLDGQIDLAFGMESWSSIILNHYINSEAAIR